MSTIMEMAQTIRDEEAAALAGKAILSANGYGKPQLIDLRDSDQVTRWCRTFGATPFQLCRAVEKVGGDAVSVQRQLRIR